MADAEKQGAGRPALAPEVLAVSKRWEWLCDLVDGIEIISDETSEVMAS